MSRLKWIQEGFQSWSAWTTVDDVRVPFEFALRRNDLGFKLTVFDHRKKPGMIAPIGLPVLTLHFSHREWTDAQMFDWVEQVRDMVPTFTGHQEWTDAEILEWDRRRREAMGQQTRCQFVHVFARGADDSTVCECGRVTKGFYRETRKTA